MRWTDFVRRYSSNGHSRVYKCTVDLHEQMVFACTPERFLDRVLRIAYGSLTLRHIVSCSPYVIPVSFIAQNPLPDLCSFLFISLNDLGKCFVRRRKARVVGVEKSFAEYESAVSLIVTAGIPNWSPSARIQFNQNPSAIVTTNPRFQFRYRAQLVALLHIVKCCLLSFVDDRSILILRPVSPSRPSSGVSQRPNLANVLPSVALHRKGRRSLPDFCRYRPKFPNALGLTLSDFVLLQSLFQILLLAPRTCPEVKRSLVPSPYSLTLFEFAHMVRFSVATYSLLNRGNRPNFYAHLSNSTRSYTAIVAASTAGPFRSYAPSVAPECQIVSGKVTRLLFVGSRFQPPLTPARQVRLPRPRQASYPRSYPYFPRRALLLTAMRCRQRVPEQISDKMPPKLPLWALLRSRSTLKQD